MKQTFFFFLIRTSGVFEVKFLGQNYCTEKIAAQIRDVYSRNYVGDCRIIATTEYFFKEQG